MFDNNEINLVNSTPVEEVNSESNSSARANIQHTKPAPFTSSELPSTSCISTDESDRNPKSTEEKEGSQTLEKSLEKYNIILPAKTVRVLNEYCDLLWTWNERLNLTRHTTYDKFVSRDLIDSIHMASLLQKGEHILDVGSGGGVPGLVIAILRPDVIVELCEATGKKANALGAMTDTLGLNTTVWYAKAQDLVRERHFHTLTIRAVDKMRNLLLMFGQTWHCFNRILMIKGPKWPDERGEARHYNMFNALALRKLDEYTVPGPETEEFTSVILQVCRKNRLEELQRRASDLAKGQPYDGSFEEIVVDNRPLDHLREQRTERRRGIGKRFNNNNSRHYITVKDKRREENNDYTSEVTSKAYARYSGKPPKGWTGKKSEFHSETENVNSPQRTPPSRKDWRNIRNLTNRNKGSQGPTNGQSSK